MERTSGILMHISALPSDYGIGTFGDEAYKFIDFLEKSGQRVWQILPLGPTSYGDSPYQSFSAFAGNPYFIDLDLLNKQGLLEKKEYENLEWGKKINAIDYEKLFKLRYRILRIAFERAEKNLKSNMEEFVKENSFWINDYALYMALKELFKLEKWTAWENDYKFRKEKELEAFKIKNKKNIDFWIFIQYLFYNQWGNLKEYANKKNIKIIGDIPIYVAEDSADTWSNPKNFLLNSLREPIMVAGCPPDAFSETGQLWGNPLYDWEQMEKTNFKWWVERIRQSLKLYDVIRIDHFRGLESYWEVAYGEKTAINGKWAKGPAMKLFKAIKEELGNVNIIAEDLGFLTERVVNFREESGFPGMKVLQFAFDSGSNNIYLPHNYEKNTVVYTGTHDNNTIKGWIKENLDNKSFSFAKDYFKMTLEEGYNWGIIRGAWASTSNLAITTAQDILDLDSSCRMNKPSTKEDNWIWRAKKGDFTEALANKLFKLTELYGRK